MSKEYKHENGYSAILYGKSSLSVQYDGKEVLHTGSRAVNTEEEVMDLLETFPEFRRTLEGCFKEMYEDDSFDEDDDL